jgi:regulator of sigma E protease
MGFEPFINQFVEIVSLVKKPIFINKTGEKFLVSLVQKPEEMSFSIDEVLAGFSGKAILYKLVEKDGKLTADFTSESEITSAKDQSLGDLLKGLEFYPIDLSVRNVVMASPADKAQIKKGDILVEVDGKKLRSFEDLRQGLQLFPDGKEVEVKILTAGKTVTKKLIPEVKEIEKKKTKIIGIESAVEYVQPKLIIVKSDNFGEAVLGAFTRTWDGVVKTFSGYKKLITREVSLNNIGGPLAIGKVASDSFNISLSMFFRLMAIISINLGVINLFPIPVLDGGHIMFLIFETFNGGPLSRRKLEIAQKFGVSILFFLIFVALFNDISKLF